MKPKLAKRLLSRKLDRLNALHRSGVRALTKSESKLIKKCTQVLLKEV